MADGIITPINVARSWHWFRQVTALCNVACGSGMTCHRIRPNVCHIGILHLISILTISPQSTCHSAPVCEILSKSDHPQQKKMTSCRFSRWRISAILDFSGPIMGSLKSRCTTSVVNRDHSSLSTTTWKIVIILRCNPLAIGWFCIEKTGQNPKIGKLWAQ